MTWGPPESDQLLSKDNIFGVDLKFSNETSINTPNPVRTSLQRNI